MEPSAESLQDGPNGHRKMNKKMHTASGMKWLSRAHTFLKPTISTCQWTWLLR